MECSNAVGRVSSSSHTHIIPDSYTFYVQFDVRLVTTNEQSQHRTLFFTNSQLASHSALLACSSDCAACSLIVSITATRSTDSSFTACTFLAMTARRLFGNKHANVLARMDRLLLTGLYQPPLWYNALRRCPPTLLYSEPHPGNITFPEDRLYPRLYERLPQLRDEALHVSSINEASVGRRVAERWSNEIDKDKNKDEEAAWQRVMDDAETKQLLTDYDKRFADSQQSPITAGNIQRHMQTKLEQMGTLRQRFTTASSPAAYYNTPLHTQSEVESALDLVAAANHANKQRIDVASPYREANSEMTSERAGLQFEPNNRSWLVPDMSTVHQLRFVLPPPNAQLNHLYHSNSAYVAQPSPRDGSKVVAPLVDSSGDDDVMEWLLSKCVEQSGAGLRDWIACVLRMQIVVLRRVVLAQWRPYTNCIDSQLWRQARVILRCATVDALEGVDMDGKPIAEAAVEDAAAIRDGLPLVYHEKQAVMGREDQRKWTMLLSFVDDALARHTFSAAEMEERAPKTQWSDASRMGRSRRRTAKRAHQAEARATAWRERKAAESAGNQGDSSDGQVLV